MIARIAKNGFKFSAVGMIFCVISASLSLVLGEFISYSIGLAGIWLMYIDERMNKFSALEEMTLPSCGFITAIVVFWAGRQADLFQSDLSLYVWAIAALLSAAFLLIRIFISKY